MGWSMTEQHFDKKLLTLLFLVTLGCLMAAFFLDGSAALITTLTGVLTTFVGGIITLTSGRSSSQRSGDRTDVPNPS